MWCGGAREIRDPRVTIRWLLSKWSIFSNSPAFLYLYGSKIWNLSDFANKHAASLFEEIPLSPMDQRWLFFIKLSIFVKYQFIFGCQKYVSMHNFDLTGHLMKKFKNQNWRWWSRICIFVYVLIWEYFLE